MYVVCGMCCVMRVVVLWCVVCGVICAVCVVYVWCMWYVYWSGFITLLNKKTSKNLPNSTSHIHYTCKNFIFQKHYSKNDVTHAPIDIHSFRMFRCKKFWVEISYKKRRRSKLSKFWIPKNWLHAIMHAIEGMLYVRHTSLAQKPYKTQNPYKIRTHSTHKTIHKIHTPSFHGWQIHFLMVGIHFLIETIGNPWI